MFPYRATITPNAMANAALHKLLEICFEPLLEEVVVDVADAEVAVADTALVAADVE